MLQSELLGRFVAHTERPYDGCERERLRGSGSDALFLLPVFRMNRNNSLQCHCFSLCNFDGDVHEPKMVEGGKMQRQKAARETAG